MGARREVDTHSTELIRNRTDRVFRDGVEADCCGDGSCAVEARSPTGCSYQLGVLKSPVSLSLTHILRTWGAKGSTLHPQPDA